MLQTLKGFLKTGTTESILGYFFFVICVQLHVECQSLNQIINFTSDCLFSIFDWLKISFLLSEICGGNWKLPPKLLKSQWCFSASWVLLMLKRWCECSLCECLCLCVFFQKEWKCYVKGPGVPPSSQQTQHTITHPSLYLSQLCMTYFGNLSSWTINIFFGSVFLYGIHGGTDKTNTGLKRKHFGMNTWASSN